MTTLTLPPTTPHPGHLRPLPWRRMAWVTWRQHRLTLAGVGTLLGAAAAYLLVTGLLMRSDYAAVAACRPAASQACTQVAGDFLNAHVRTVGATLGLLQVVPALIGVYVGAPVLARELETGTFRFAWTQGLGRTRWTVAKLASLALAVTAAAGAFGLLVSWYVQPIWDAGDENGALYPTIFDLRGVAPAAWTLVAFAIGALAGALLRRVVPAMFATFAGYAGLAVGTGAYLRQHYLAPLITTNPDGGMHTWVISRLWMRGGSPVSLDEINQALRSLDIQAVGVGQFQPGPASSPSVDPVQYLVQHGYALVTTYQPDSRFWPFQWIEGGWLLAFSLALFATTVWLVRRRAT
jgi:ABC-2 family transporter protein